MGKRFKRAERGVIPIRVFMMGKSKGGKSRSGLQVGQHLAEQRAKAGAGNGRLACIETELVGDASRATSRLAMYRGEPCECEECRSRGMVIDFDIIMLGEHERAPKDYTAALLDAYAEGYSVVLIDGLWHGWKAILAWTDELKKSNPRSDPWLKARPVYREWIESMLNYPGDLIACCRTKTKYDRNVPKGQSYVNLGDKPDFSDGIEYEFDHAFYMADANAHCVGSRATELRERTYTRPGLRLATDLAEWSVKVHRNEDPPAEGGRTVEPVKRSAPVRPPRDEQPTRGDEQACPGCGKQTARRPMCNACTSAGRPGSSYLEDPETCKHGAWTAGEKRKHPDGDAQPGASCDACGLFQWDKAPHEEKSPGPSESGTGSDPSQASADTAPAEQASSGDSATAETSPDPSLTQLVEAITPLFDRMIEQTAHVFREEMNRCGGDVSKLANILACAEQVVLIQGCIDKAEKAEMGKSEEWTAWVNAAGFDVGNLEKTLAHIRPLVEQTAST